MVEINNFDSMKVSLASPEKIREWSYGEVTKPETINYRTQKPERDGLFCEKIFGPEKNYECSCGKYKKPRYKGIICDKCGVEVTKSIVRRERMGHIELASPVAHIWYFRGVPGRMSMLLDMSAKQVESVIFYGAYVVLSANPETGLQKKQVISPSQYEEYKTKFGLAAFKAGMGAEAMKVLLREFDVEKESVSVREELVQANGSKKLKLAKRLELIESFRLSGNKPEWMILDVIPVLPPELRPMVPLDGGRYANSDLNDLYRRVINRNNRLKKLKEQGCPELIIQNEKRLLQNAVDSLIDNGKPGKPLVGSGGRPLKSLTDYLRGKQGRFRLNLLGKRVDYSGRSVIVVGPELKLYQCGLPKEMALELFKPFVMRLAVDKGIVPSGKQARKYVERERSVVWDLLEEAIKDHPVLLNRAPTLHRLGIQAFEPVLVDGHAIKLHPLVCTAFNADFDGDQMAVHVPLSVEAQVEARFLMLSTNNILKLSDGQPVVSPTQDMVLGSYYLTLIKEGAKGEGRFFSSKEEAIMAYQIGQLGLQAKIHVRMSKEEDGMVYRKRLETTVGRIIFNGAIPQDIGIYVPKKDGSYFIERDKDSMVDLSIDTLVKKSVLSDIIKKCFKMKGATEVSLMLDNIKSLGFKYSTIGAITASVFDMQIPGSKNDILAKADEKVLEIEKSFKRGIVNENGRYKEIVEIWKKATEDVETDLKKNFETYDKFNNIWIIVDSGARGNMGQIKQLSGMRGLMVDPTGKTIEIPVKSSFREGLTVLEYFIASHGARKGGADTALKTADSGYLTRRLVDVAHDVIIQEEDCGDTAGFLVKELKDSAGKIIETLIERTAGRYSVNDIISPITGEVLVSKGEMISEDQAKAISESGIKEVKIRSVLTCKSKKGICAKCYGANMSSWNPVKLGEAVGIIAAQSIGEPGTQLTMRTFHTGGIASGADITVGLPRVEELFEARRPKGCAVVSAISGTVTVEDTEAAMKHITVFNSQPIKDKDTPSTWDVKIPKNSIVTVKTGDIIEKGDPIMVGPLDPKEINQYKGLPAVQEYLIVQVQSTYRGNNAHIQDKHIEIILRQMTNKIKVAETGDSNFIVGQVVPVNIFNEENDALAVKELAPPKGKRTLLGISKAASAAEGFLSAASFQETAKILADAAIGGKSDNFIGLKENVIVGKLIPAGTGMKRYRSVTYEKSGVNLPEDAVIDRKPPLGEDLDIVIDPEDN
ncbi:MAG: DNA-directed RNA polymerase subunit beta' [Firmicutes bacterium ADurb.Bin080]|nr:MAG: DNA-directed RNA polymerase subunit beta' [Firmicutes bacterium ADurb.Bin080]